MKRIIGKTSTGKTKQLITEAALVDNSILLCKHPRGMEEKMLYYNVGYVPCYSYKDFLYGIESLPENAIIFIDDLEEFSEVLTHYRLQGYGLTID